MTPCPTWRPIDREPRRVDRIRIMYDLGLKVTLNDGVHEGSFIVDLLLQHGLRLKMFKEEEINLEDVFLGITKGITN